MNRGFLIKVGLLAATLIVVLVIMISAMMMTGAEADGQVRHSPFGQFVVAGGPIVWLVQLPLSMVMVYWGVLCALRIRRQKLLPMGIGRRLAELVRNGATGPLEKQLAEGKDLVSVAAADAVTRSRGDLHRMETLFEESLGEQAGGLFRRIEWLNLIGQVAPMIGLLGTVLGIIKVFNAIVATGGDLLPAKFADGLSVALVTTFWGLLIAIPALSVHGVLRNRIETVVNDAMGEVDLVLAEVAKNRRQQQVQAAPAVAATPTTPQEIREFRPKRTKVVREPSTQAQQDA